MGVIGRRFVRKDDRVLRRHHGEQSTSGPIGIRLYRLRALHVTRGKAVPPTGPQPQLLALFFLYVPPSLAQGRSATGRPLTRVGPPGFDATHCSAAADGSAARWLWKGRP